MRSPLRAVLGALAVGLLLVTATVLWRFSGDDEQPRSVPFTAVPTEVIDGPGQAVAWTGEALFSYGGFRRDAFRTRSFPLVNTALLFDPRTGSGRTVPEPPVDRALSPRSVVASGDWGSVILAGNECRDIDAERDDCSPGTFRILRFDLRAGSWTSIELPDAARGGTDPTRTILGATDELVVFQLGDSKTPDYWTYGIADENWLRVPTPRERVDAVCLTGDKLVTASASFVSGSEILADDPIELDGRDGSGGPGDGYTRPRIAVLDLMSTVPAWATSAPAKDFRTRFPEDRIGLACTADTALVHDGGTQVRLHTLDAARLDEPWRTTPEPDNRPYGQVLAEEGTFVFLSANSINTSEPVPGAPARSYSLATGRWTYQPQLPPVSDALTLTGDRLVGFTSSYDRSSEIVDERLRTS